MVAEEEITIDTERAHVCYYGDFIRMQSNSSSMHVSTRKFLINQPKVTGRAKIYPTLLPPSTERCLSRKIGLAVSISCRSGGDLAESVKSI